MSHDNWPMPGFDAGNPKHLHAVGVIALTFTQFERSVDLMFLHHPANSEMPFDLRERNYFALSEGQRVAAIRNFYSNHERDVSVKEAARNVLNFFDWAHDSRN